MISVEQLIGDLLLRHNCVIIPSFGGFVAKRTSASIDYSNGVMTPPRKSLLFNRQLINNDGLLIAELAVSNKIQYSESTDIISELVKTWNDQLKNGERISIDKVGFLYFDAEKNICFEQDRFFNLLLESYGLEKVHFLSENDVQLAQKTTIEREIKVDENSLDKSVIVFNTETIKIEKETSIKPVIEHPALKSKTNVWKYVAAACLLPIAFYSFWLPMKTNVLESGMISVKDFNPFYHSQDGDYAKKELKEDLKKDNYKTLEQTVALLDKDVKVFSYKYDDDLYIPVRISTTSPKTIDDNSTFISNNSSKYEFIVGCFGNENNALNVVESLKSNGIQGYIYDVSNGLKRVSAGNAATENELQKTIQKAEALGYEGWVLKK